MRERILSHFHHKDKKAIVPYKRIFAMIAALLMGISLSSGTRSYAAFSDDTIDFKQLYDALMEHIYIYGKELIVSGAVASFMESDKDGVYIYVLDDPGGGTGAGIGFYRQHDDDYCIYYGEFVDFQRHGQGNVIDGYQDDNEDWTQRFYGVWEDDYPNGPGQSYYTYEDQDQIITIETDGVYNHDGFTGTMISSQHIDAGPGAGTIRETSQYVNSYGDGKFTKTCTYKDGSSVDTSWKMANGYPVIDRTSEYIEMFGMPNGFDPASGVIVGWSDDGDHCVYCSVKEPWVYRFDYFLALSMND